MNMTALDYEAEYNNRARVPEHPAIIDGWARDAAAYRDAARSRYRRLPYGAGERLVIDLFDAEAPRVAPTVVFIHGGYWQGLDPSFFSHLARGLNAHGLTVAIPGYDLCPQVRVGDIVDQMRQACAVLADQGPLVATGHSAGGHLAACLLATDWRKLGLRADLVGSAYAISGLFDLAPLLATQVNTALRMSEPEARRLSPIAWPAPAGRIFDAVVGAQESSEYLRQSREMVESWGRGGVVARYEEVPGANHFTVIAPLREPDSAMTRRIADLARS
jgi:arylformamidase